MQTCPYCHHVLASPSPVSCCSHSQQLQSFFSIPSVNQSPFVAQTNPFIFPQQTTPSTNPFISTFQSQTVNGFNETEQCSQTSSLPTPHVSGHMFHFPSMRNGLPQTNGCSHGATSCQLSCRINCMTHGGQVQCNPVWPSRGVSVSDEDSQGPYAHGGFILTKIPGKIAEDKRVLEESSRKLQISGWYWQKFSWQQAVSLLEHSEVGTFIMRDSSDPHHKYSLSVQTEKGPTSVRVHFHNQKFRLDCEAGARTTLPEFSCVIKLIEHYISINEKMRRHVWVDSEGKLYSAITIKKPYCYKVDSLKHLCRLSINKSYSPPDSQEKLPPPLVSYLEEYPHIC